MNILDWSQLQQYLSENYGLLDELLILATTFFALLAWRIAGKRIQRWVSQTRTQLDDSIWHALKKPIYGLIAFTGASVLVQRLADNLDSQFIDRLPAFRSICYAILITWFLMRLIARIERTQILLGRDVTTVVAIGKLCKACVFVISALAIFQVLGFSISGVIAFGGVGGLVVGMGAKDLLANFFGAIMIYFDKPFKVGDWIRSPDRNIEGTVEIIGWRSTMIRTFDKRPLYVPNGVFSSIAVENPSRMSNRRIYETIGLRYKDSERLEAVVNDIRAMLSEHPDIDQQQTLIVNFYLFGPSSLDIMVYTFTRTTNWIEYHQIKQRVLLAIVAIVKKHGAEFAFPSQSLYHETLPIEWNGLDLQGKNGRIGALSPSELSQ